MSSSTSTTKVPAIDFNKENLIPGTSCWISTFNDVRNALEEYGFFLAEYDKACLELNKNAIFDGLQDLFDLPTETKVLNTSDQPYFGYIGLIPSLPLYESFGIEDATSLEAIQRFANLMWPSGNHHFCEILHSYNKLVSGLEHMVKRMVFESYGVEKYYDSHVESTTYLLRMAKYKARKTNETDIGLEVHTDKSFISILHQNQVNGLEIRTKDGKWISVDFKPSSFLVMAGDAFMAWSNNRVHSAYHRVTMKANEARFSVGLFSYLKGMMVQTPEELVDDDHPLQFKPFDHFGYIAWSNNRVRSAYHQVTMKANEARFSVGLFSYLKRDDGTNT